MPGEAWDGIAGVLSLAGGGRDGSGGLLQLAFGGQLGHGPGSIWLGQDKEGCSLPPCQISSLGSVRNNLGHIFGGVLSKRNLRHLKRRDRVTLQAFKESPSGLA